MSRCPVAPQSRPTSRSRTFCIATIETRSRVDLRKVGAHRYAADPSTEVLCMAYAVDDGPVQLWRPRRPSSGGILRSCGESELGRSVRTTTLSKPPLSSMCCIPASAGRSFRSSATVCTQAMCLALGLPAKLSAAADALELENRKDAAGERLMHQMSKPRRARQGEDPGGYVLV